MTPRATSRADRGAHSAPDEDDGVAGGAHSAGGDGRGVHNAGGDGRGVHNAGGDGRGVHSARGEGRGADAGAHGARGVARGAHSAAAAGDHDAARTGAHDDAAIGEAPGRGGRVPKSHRAVPKRVSRRAALAAAAGTALAATGIGVWRVLAGGSEPADAPRASATRVGPSAAASKQNLAKAQPSASTAPVLLDGGPVPGVRGRALLGAYLDLSGMNLAQAVALRRRQLGRDERIMHAFSEWTDLLPTSIAGAPAGAVPMISWRGTYHADILSGKYDSHIAVNARRLAQDRRPKFLRWGWEMNGNWYAWSGAKNGNDPAGYIACWKRIHQIFADQGAGNVAWVWSVNWNSAPDTPQNTYQAYYPGDKFVDWVGISGYDLHHEAPPTLFDELYEGYAAQKPMMISEVGSVDYGGTTKGDWVRDFAAYVGRRPNIAAVCWFDTDTHRNYSETWRIDTNPNALAAYRLMAQSPRFSG